MREARERIELTDAQVRWFRARRSHLAGPGAASPMAAARDLLGAQAQQEGPALHALSLRTAGRPTAAELRSMLLEGDRPLVRTWGQRDTLHLYAATDWATFVAARGEWPESSRRGGMPTDGELAIARRAFRAAGGPLFHRDLFELVPERLLAEVAAHPGVPEGQAIRFAASRLVWRLAMEGDLCFAHKEGAQQAYVHRQHWCPDLGWPDALDPTDATTDLARRYLAVHGPATATDLAHFFGARVTAARRWLGRLEGELVDVACGDRRGLVALAADRDALLEVPPAGDGWPLRLLPQWDTHLMRHKERGWLVEDEAEAPRVWARAAVVKPVVLHRGRIVAIWGHRTTTRELRLTVTPLAGWQAALRGPVEAEAEAFAAHLELRSWRVTIGVD